MAPAVAKFKLARRRSAYFIAAFVCACALAWKWPAQYPRADIFLGADLVLMALLGVIVSSHAPAKLVHKAAYGCACVLLAVIGMKLVIQQSNDAAEADRQLRGTLADTQRSLADLQSAAHRPDVRVEGTLAVRELAVGHKLCFNVGWNNVGSGIAHRMTLYAVMASGEISGHQQMLNLLRSLSDQVGTAAQLITSGDEVQPQAGEYNTLVGPVWTAEEIGEFAHGTRYVIAAGHYSYYDDYGRITNKVFCFSSTKNPSVHDCSRYVRPPP